MVAIIPLAAAPVALHFDEPGNTLWYPTAAGEVHTVRFSDRRTRLRGSGFTQPVAAVPLHDGLGVAVVEASGRVFVAHRDDVSPAASAEVVTVAGPVLAAHRHPDLNRLLVLTPSLLVAVDLDTASVDVVSTEVFGAIKAT